MSAVLPGGVTVLRVEAPLDVDGSRVWVARRIQLLILPRMLSASLGSRETLAILDETMRP